MDNIDPNIKKYVKKSIDEITDFTSFKITDTPKDAYSPANRHFVTLNGTTSGRPPSSIVGQFYLDMSLAAGNGKPIYWNGTGWIDSTGTYV